jgi:hypothetical protein
MYMKALTYIIAILAIAAIAIVVGKNKHIDTDEPEIVTPALVVTESCYVWNTEAGDSATLRVKGIQGGNTVTGFFDWAPAEKDHLSGTFAGTANEGGADGLAYYTAWWKVSGEGMTNTQELKFATSTADGLAAVAFGEMKDRGDGTYVYADESKLSYAPNLIKTDCADPAVRR